MPWELTVVPFPEPPVPGLDFSISANADMEFCGICLDQKGQPAILAKATKTEENRSHRFVVLTPGASVASLGAAERFKYIGQITAKRTGQLFEGFRYQDNVLLAIFYVEPLRDLLEHPAVAAGDA